jgi:thiol-disulfide isomerase/thioredoxin
MLTKSPWKLAQSLLLAGAAVAALAADDPKKPPPVPAGGDSAEVAQALQDAWPDHPEWVDMLTAILQDEPMSSTYGWFRTAVAQTRFDWEASKKRYDRNGNGQIDRTEFPGSDGDFARLDRDRNKALTRADFDFSNSALAPSPGSMVFMRLDRDGSGKVSREELDEFFQTIDSGGQGFLSLADLQEAFTPPPASARPSPASGRPSKATLVRGLFRQEIGSLQPGPKLDESAPDFTLKTNDGNAEITLSKVIGPKPVVLVFGSFTCGPFRSHSGNIEKLYQKYKDRATFVMVYVREAHPTDGWRMESNDRVGATTAQPKSYEERVDVAQKCGKLFNIGFPMLVDTIDDTVGARYSGIPGRLYLIDRDGKVAFKSGRGPYLFKPAELEQSLVLLLQQDGPTNSSKGHASIQGESSDRDGDKQPSRLVREQRGSSDRP